MVGNETHVSCVWLCVFLCRYVAHYTEVRRVAPEGIMRIMMASPALALELMDATHEAARQQHK